MSLSQMVKAVSMFHALVWTLKWMKKPTNSTMTMHS
jgi:hypothetical protein